MEYFISLRGILIVFLIIIGFVWILLRPRAGLGFIFLVSLLRDGFLFVWFPPIYDLHIPQIIIILTLVSWLCHINEYPLRINSDIILVFCFFLVICATRFFAGTSIWDHPVTNENLRTVIIFFLVIQLSRTPRDIRKMLWLIVGIHLFLVLRAYYFYKTDYMDIALPNYSLVNRNSFGGLLALTLPLAYRLGDKSKHIFQKCLGLFTALWCIIGVILTYSRSALIGMLAGILGLILIERRKAKFIFIIIALTALIMPRLSEKYTGRMETIETYQEDASAMGRVATNYAAISMFKQNPILGVGAGNFNDAFLAYTPPEYLKWVDEGKSIHNIILQVASETGLLGLAFFLPLFLGGFRNFFVKISNDTPQREELLNLKDMLMMSFVVVFVTSQFGQGAYHGSIYIVLPFLSALKQNIYDKNTANQTTYRRSKINAS